VLEAQAQQVMPLAELVLIVLCQDQDLLPYQLEVVVEVGPIALGPAQELQEAAEALVVEVGPRGLVQHILIKALQEEMVLGMSITLVQAVVVEVALQV